MNNIVKINDTELQVIEYQGQRVATFTQVDSVHKRSEGTAGRNFREHKHRLVEGEDFIQIGADEFRRHLDPSHSKFASEDVTLLLESGYLILVKSFTDDLAWQVQRQLVKSYFKSQAHITPPAQKDSRVKEAASDKSGLPEFRKAKALELATKTAERIVAQFPGLSEQSRQTVFAKVINPVAGIEILALPRVEQKHLSAGEVGEKLGISAAMVGRISNLHGLKTEEFGMYLLDKSKHSSKQVETFVYNNVGVDAIKIHLDADQPNRLQKRKPAAKVLPVRDAEPQGALL